jgi:ribosomal RNA-processing protein 9
MARPKARSGGKARQGGPAKKRKVDAFDDEDHFFLADEQEALEKVDDELPEEAEVEETAEEKRLRLGAAPGNMHVACMGAHRRPRGRLPASRSSTHPAGPRTCAGGAYWCPRRPLRPPRLSVDSAPRRSAAKAYLQQVREAEADELGEPLGDEAVTQRLRDEALDAMGHLRRLLAARVVLPPLPPLGAGGGAPSSGRMLRGHRLSVTAIALSHDDATVYSVSKDGAVLRHDVESGVRRAEPLAWGGAQAWGVQAEAEAPPGWLEQQRRRLVGSATLAPTRSP